MSFKKLTLAETLKCQEELASGTAVVEITPTDDNMLNLHISGLFVAKESLYSAQCDNIAHLADGNY